MAADDDFARLARDNLRDALEHLHNTCVRLGRADCEHAEINLVGQLDHHAAINGDNRHIWHRLCFRSLSAIARSATVCSFLQIRNKLFLALSRFFSLFWLCLGLRVCGLLWRCGRRGFRWRQLFCSLARPVVRAERITISITTISTGLRTSLRTAAIAFRGLVLQDACLMREF